MWAMFMGLRSTELPAAPSTKGVPMCALSTVESVVSMDAAAAAVAVDLLGRMNARMIASALARMKPLKRVSSPSPHN